MLLGAGECCWPTQSNNSNGMHDQADELWPEHKEGHAACASRAPACDQKLDQHC